MAKFAEKLAAKRLELLHGGEEQAEIGLAEQSSGAQRSLVEIENDAQRADKRLFGGVKFANNQRTSSLLRKNPKKKKTINKGETSISILKNQF